MGAFCGSAAELVLGFPGEAFPEKAVVVHSTTSYGYNCNYLADSVAKYPDTLQGMGLGAGSTDAHRDVALRPQSRHAS